MNNLLQYILSFMFIDYGMDVPGVIAGGCDGRGVTYKVTQARKGWVTIEVTNGKMRTTTNEPADSNWSATARKMMDEMHAFDHVDVEKIARRLRGRYMENREKFLKEIGVEKEWQNS